MPEWFTILPTSSLAPEQARAAMAALIRFSAIAYIPKSATWRAFLRPIGVLVTAEWAYDAPGAVHATEVDLIAGIPVLVEDKNGEKDGN